MADETSLRHASNQALFHDGLRLVAHKIPAYALAWLWTIHQKHGEFDCNAHRAGRTCCVDVILERQPPPVTTSEAELMKLLQILAAGWDVCVEHVEDIESAGDAKDGPISIFLSYQNQKPSTRDRTFHATPESLGDALDEALKFAQAFPAVKA